jgi:recA bacterial DNA recombination protein
MSSPASFEITDSYFPLRTEKKCAALLEQLSEIPKLSNVVQASHLEIRPAPKTASSGIAQIDALTGGLPRGCLTEVCGPDSSGRTSLLLSALRAATLREEICTLIDVSDAFDPHSAAAAGVNLERLLWIRCNAHSSSSYSSHRRRPAQSLEEWERRRREDPVEQALRATDLLLQSSGFGLVVIDLAGVPLKIARRIPLTTWFRFQRAVENTPTIFLVIAEQACAQSCAALQLVLNSVPGSQCSVSGKNHACNGQDHCNSKRPSHAELLNEMEIHAKVLRSRAERKPSQSVKTAFTTKAAWNGR